MREFKELQHILSYTRKAVDDYSMIVDGDSIAIGVSGGKDSMTLLCAMKGLQRFYPKKFEIKAITLDMNMPGSDITPISKLCNEIEIEHIIVPTDIYKIVFDIRKETNPCSLCAKMRRGALHDAAIAAGCRKVALGHHFDDAVETLMMNLFNEGRIGCFSPVSYLDRKNITLIRPLLYLPEKLAARFIRRENIEIPSKTCPADGNTDRERIKQLIATLEKDDRGLKARIFGAMERAELSGFHPNPGKPRRDLI
ncbi:MAG: tRNA 2-thiocytidine(32) synthetase TtcA [Clostridiales bacterium GWF2_38_85]|nr:MAG: tRNA 2-thiocytidine(32) synthetase TtcA [Clostridiales bacterium GWF2_38_85]HBL84040.1 tRNA 2-thiocytidine(32) synthetase TtcA [Clostridiales bacterium]